MKTGHELALELLLNELAEQVRHYGALLVEAERNAGDLDGRDDRGAARAEALAFEARLLRDRALVAYFEASERARALARTRGRAA